MGSGCCSSNPRVLLENEKSQLIKKLLDSSKTIDEFKKEYEFVCNIAQSSNGIVSLYRSSHNHTLNYAVKTIKRNGLNNQAKFVINEINVLKLLDHPNIVKYYQTYEDQDIINIVLEYIEGDSLEKYLVKKGGILSENECIKIIFQLLKTLQYLHNNGIIYRNICPTNLIFNKSNELNSFKIIDFRICQIFTNQAKNDSNISNSSSNCINDEENQINKENGKINLQLIKVSYQDLYGRENYNQYKNQLGKPHYMSPEAIKGEPNEKTDCWAVGVLLFLLLTGKYPYNGNKKDKIFSEITSGHYKNGLLKNFSSEVKDFISKLFKVELVDRLDINQALKHCWFNSLNFKKSIIDNSTIKNIIKFRQTNILQKEVAFFLGKLSGNKVTKRISKLNKIFENLDNENVGVLRYNQLSEGLKKIGVNDVIFYLF